MTARPERRGVGAEAHTGGEGQAQRTSRWRKLGVSLVRLTATGAISNLPSSSAPNLPIDTLRLL